MSDTPEPPLPSPLPSVAPPAPGPRRFSYGEAWPFYAAGALVAGTLLAVFVFLHPRRAGAGAGDEGAPATVTAEEATLQREASAKGAALATLAQGKRVRVGVEAARWVAVEADGQKGFVPADAVERDADREARERRAKTLLALAPVYGVVGEDTDIALAPYPLAARGGRLARGAVIAIHSVDHSYFAFADKKWGIAFVDSARVDLVPPDPREPAVSPEKVRPLKDLAVIDLAAEPPPDEEAAGDVVESGAAPSPAAAAAPVVPAEPAPGLLDAPTVLTRVEPSYPEVARKAGIEGTVELEVSVDATGKVTDVEVARGLPLGLSEAAADAVRRWTWRPARTASGPVASRKTVRVRFLLRPEDAR
jgi:TonB family protein